MQGLNLAAGILRGISELRRVRRERWEGLCRHCGVCCYEKRLRYGAVVVDFARPCPFLDPRDKTCTVYERRFSTCPECRKMTIVHALFTTYLPDDCGYVQRYRFWRRTAKGGSEAWKRGSGSESGLG